MRAFLKLRFLVGFILLVNLISVQAGKSPVADARVGFSPDEVTQKYIYTVVGKKVYFDGSRSFDQDSEGSIAKYYWNFGDGVKDSGVKKEHEYSSPGKYTVRLMVVDLEGKPSELASEVEVFINSSLTAEIKLPQKKGFVKDSEEKIHFLGEAKGGTPCYETPHYKYKWISDISGVIGNKKEFFLSANLPLGKHKITLEVTDCLGDKANDSVEIGITRPLEAEITESCQETFSGNSLTLGRVVFDSSWTRFIPYPPYSEGINSCNNSQYVANIAKWLDQNGRILIYLSGNSEVGELKNFLEEKGYNVEVVKRANQKITSSLLSTYGQVWFLDRQEKTKLEDDEIEAVKEYHENKGNLLLSGEANEEYASFAVMVNSISRKMDVEMEEKLEVEADENNCAQPAFISHDLTKGLTYLSTSGDDVLINSFTPQTEVLARINEKPYLLALDYETVTPKTKSYLCDCEVKLSGKVRGGLPPYQVKWISLEDGVIDRYWIKEEGGSYTLSRTLPMLAPLSNGTHSIKFEVIDSLGRKASDTRYEVHVKNCCALEASCQTYWPEKEGPLVNTGNEYSHACDIYEVCHPDLWPLAREAIEACKWKCQGNFHKYCNYSYSEGAKLGTTPEGLTLDGLKKCAGLYIIYGLGPGERYMSDYFWPEICCLGHPYCLEECCQQDLGKCRCIYHVYTKNQQALPCKGYVSSSPRGWKSDTAMNENTCLFSDLPAHVNILGDEGIATEASGINTGTCVDYSNALTTLLRIVGYKANEVYSLIGPGHAFNLVKFPQDQKYHLIDTVGNCHKAWGEYNDPYVPKSLPTCVSNYPYCTHWNCHNDKGTFPCPPNSQIYGC